MLESTLYCNRTLLIFKHPTNKASESPEKALLLSKREIQLENVIKNTKKQLLLIREWNQLMEVGGGGGAAERVIKSLKDIAPDVLTT